jgi:SAM-dependent methyltransferase
MSSFAEYAPYYDRMYGDKDYEAEAAFVLGLVRRHCPRAESFLELGCGTGAHAEHLSAAGVRVHGVDRSEAMLERARARQERLPREVSGRLIFSHGDVRHVRIGETFDAVVSLFHVVSYQSSNQDLRECFATAKLHLKPGGVFVFDCWYGPAVLSDRPSVRVKRWQDDQTSVTRIAEPVLHANENVVDVNYTIFVRNRASEVTRVFEELHRMRYLFPPEVSALASMEGLEMIEARAWMSEGQPGLDSWNACFVVRAL